jgi:hypothetical protein
VFTAGSLVKLWIALAFVLFGLSFASSVLFSGLFSVMVRLRRLFEGMKKRFALYIAVPTTLFFLALVCFGSAVLLHLFSA